MNVWVIPIQSRRLIRRNPKPILKRRAPRLNHRVQRIVLMAHRRQRQPMKMQIRERPHRHCHSNRSRRSARRSRRSNCGWRCAYHSRNRHRAARTRSSRRMPMRFPIARMRRYVHVVFQTQYHQIARLHAQSWRFAASLVQIAVPLLPARLNRIAIVEINSQHAINATNLIRLSHHAPRRRPPRTSPSAPRLPKRPSRQPNQASRHATQECERTPTQHKIRRDEPILHQTFSLIR